jgi:hypothetical protein
MKPASSMVVPLKKAHPTQVVEASKPNVIGIHRAENKNPAIWQDFWQDSLK